MAVKIIEYNLTNKGSLVCPMYLTSLLDDKLRAVLFRADTGADRTYMSIYSLIENLKYTAADIRKNVKSDLKRYSVYADGSRELAKFVTIPEVWFLGKCFINCPVYIDGKADYEEIEIKVKLDEIEDDEDGTGNLLGLELLTQFKINLEPERWCAEFYSIANPLRNLCKENGIKISSMKLQKLKVAPLFKDAKALLKIIKESPPFSKKFYRSRELSSISANKIEKSLKELLDAKLVKEIICKGKIFYHEVT